MKVKVQEIGKAWLDNVVGEIILKQEFDLENEYYAFSENPRLEPIVSRYSFQLKRYMDMYRDTKDGFRYYTVVDGYDKQRIFSVVGSNTIHIDYLDTENHQKLCYVTISPISVLLGDDYLSVEIRDTEYYYNNKERYGGEIFVNNEICRELFEMLLSSANRLIINRNTISPKNVVAQIGAFHSL